MEQDIKAVFTCRGGTCPDLVLSDSAKETVLQLGWDYFKT